MRPTTVIRRGIAHIRKYGWKSGGIGSCTGPVCATGALSVGADLAYRGHYPGVQPVLLYPTTLQDVPNVREARIAEHALAQAISPVIRPRTQGHAETVVTSWNDHAGRTSEQVLAKLSEAERLLRAGEVPLPPELL